MSTKKPVVNERQEWLDGLKAGDSVAIECRVRGLHVEKVTKRTPTGVIVVTWLSPEGGIRFDRYGHEKTSDPYYGKSIDPVTPEVSERIHRRDLLTKIRATGLGSLKTYTLIEIAILIEKDKAAPKVPA